jgi:hypothetical protein
MPFVITKTAVAAAAVSASIATAPKQDTQQCYYVPTTHVYWNSIETVMEVECYPLKVTQK